MCRPTDGEVSEWSNVHAWKACVRKRTGGSNPLLSANKRKPYTFVWGFCFVCVKKLGEDLN